MPTTTHQDAGSDRRIRVLVVDDSVVIRKLVPLALEIDAALEVVGTAAHGRIALAKIPQLNPDVVTLDIEMPEMDGLETLRAIRQRHPDLYVIMFSSLTERNAAATLEALSLGANDYVLKPAGEASMETALAALRGELVPKITQHFRRAPILSADVETLRSNQRHYPAAPAEPRLPGSILAIGVSTGGPTALSTIIPMFPADFPAPVLIVQHMPPVFTRLLAERLQKLTSLCVEEGTEGSVVEPGKVLIAPGGYHMYVRREGGHARIVLDQAAPRNSCRPSVDALFESVAAAYGSQATGVVLTGMGNDGLRGAELLKSAGARVIAQDEATSVIWGMPGLVVRAGFADAVVPLTEVIQEVLRQTEYHPLSFAGR
jgi:two-component system chemotaxis response regulator CheB